MRALIVEDDFTCRKLLQGILEGVGESDIAVNGVEAVDAFSFAHKEGKPYDVIFLDIMMPEMDGHEALRCIRQNEKELGVRGTDEVKIIMVTALDDPKNVMNAYYQGGATSYMAKPIDRELLLHLLRQLELIA
ncbi:response regulator [Desulfovibrio inopinatus]|uniref:response regulator n=1 Tax=Desulfovibrio inopinatus TaxID=102109 RepID=UPI0004055085|nr:response regulator [Desulfovibrio inopinatus]